MVPTHAIHVSTGHVGCDSRLEHHSKVKDNGKSKHARQIFQMSPCLLSCSQKPKPKRFSKCYRPARLQWHRLQWHSLKPSGYSDAFLMSKMALSHSKNGLECNDTVSFWLQWHFSSCPKGVAVSGQVCIALLLAMLFGLGFYDPTWSLCTSRPFVQKCAVFFGLYGISVAIKDDLFLTILLTPLLSRLLCYYGIICRLKIDWLRSTYRDGIKNDP